MSVPNLPRSPIVRPAQTPAEEAAVKAARIRIAKEQRDKKRQEAIVHVPEPLLITSHKAWMLNQLFPAEALGGNMPRAFPEAVLAYEETAKGGDPVSAAGMGTMHLYGWGLPQSYELARTFFFSCRNRGHPRGFTGMGILLANGWGGEKKDYEEAKKMLRRGSELGDPIALFEEAKLAKQKKGRELDWNFIFTNVEASAKKGYAIALYELGVFYFKGTPVLPYDHERSLAVLRMASEQEYTLADELIVQLKAVMWSGDVEGQTREAVRRAKDVRLELDLERVNTARQRALAEAEEARNAALEERILAEQKVLANMKQFLLRTLERAEGEVKRAEIAEKALAETKATLALVNDQIEEEKEKIKKLKARVEFMMMELRRKQRFHVDSGGRWEGEWVPIVAVGAPATVERIPLTFVRRWTCCECTNKFSKYCKPFCGCNALTEVFCAEPPVPPIGIDVLMHPVVAARLQGLPLPLFHKVPDTSGYFDLDLEDD